MEPQTAYSMYMTWASRVTYIGSIWNKKLYPINLSGAVCNFHTTDAILYLSRVCGTYKLCHVLMIFQRCNVSGV